jgi:hypothetical protein
MKPEQPKKNLGGRPPKLQVITEAQMNGMMPLDYMLAVMRDPTASQNRRDRMAAVAAPYCHARLTEAQPKGKKDQQADAALMAGMGTQWSSDLEFEDRPN